MGTECSGEQISFQGLGRRRVEAAFDGGRVSSDGGVMLLNELDVRIGLVARFAECFVDHRSPAFIEHELEHLLRQRVFGLCVGYEDLNDHDMLRSDALLAAAVGKRDPTGANRRREEDRGHALAGKSTLNRLELTPPNATKDDRYKKIVADDAAVERFFVDEFIDSQREAPPRIVLDIDPSDIEVHGSQENRFYHGYYGHYCYLPLYIFCGEALLMARLRKADIDGCDGTVDALDWLIPQLRAEWPDAEIVVRADSGFAREHILAWCEANEVEYVIGLARNSVLCAKIADELAAVEEIFEETGEPTRRFADFTYTTRSSWSRERRVVAKAEQLPGKANPRFVVTSYGTERFDARTLYESEYCHRGEMENRIKEQQLDLFGDRASSRWMRANQIRIWMAAVAYVLMVEFRRTALAGTALERAQANTIRVRLFKIGALVRVSIRRVRIALSSVFPLQQVFMQAVENIRATYAASG